MRIVFGVVLAHQPTHSAGHTFATLQWLEALRSVGADVWVIEHMATDDCIYDQGETLSRNEQFWNAFVDVFVPDGRASLVVDGHVDNEDDFREFAAGAEVFLNYSGRWHLMDWVKGCQNRVYLDVDPGYTQIWVEGYGSPMNFHGHTHFVTVGLGLNASGTRIPQAERDWITTPPPASTSLWEPWLRQFGREAARESAAWTTVTHWYGYNEIQWEGTELGNKRTSFLAFRDVPQDVLECRFEIATDMRPGWEDYDTFANRGWHFVDNQVVCADLDAYARFITASRGEIGIAKHGYVSMQSGWMSDRSMGYLACGKPVLLQETGWSQFVPHGDGLLPFHDPQSLADGIRSIESDYERHATAARYLSETVFSGTTVIEQLLAHI